MTAPTSQIRQIASATDRRILSLLDGYVALAGGSLTLLETDLYQLNVPKGDEGRFGGRSVVRLAFTVDALELDDRAEMAIVGGSFVNELIDAIRGRGSRLLAGWRFPRRRDPTPRRACRCRWRNGAVSEAQSSLARHRVGRLPRAGYSRGDRAQRAARGFESLRSVQWHRAASRRRGRLPVGPASGGGDRVLAVDGVGTDPEDVGPRREDARRSDARLRSEIEEVACGAERSLAEEVQRIDRYYTAMLQDTGDADSQRAIVAEHRRRAEEERDRHAVRAVVHPVQLTEWEMIAERATWKLNTRTGHEAYFTAQRPLAGAAVWVFGCERGTSSPRGLHVCLRDHVACDAGSAACAVCAQHYCREHGITGCHVDGKPACDEHARMCSVCRRAHCSVHEGTCSNGGHAACSSCLGSCAICGRVVCNTHALESRSDAPKGARRFCQTCAVSCEGGVAEIVGPDEVTDCASCERVVCERHRSICAVDRKVHCSRHLRRTIDRAGSSVSTIGWRARTKRTPFSRETRSPRVPRADASTAMNIW